MVWTYSGNPAANEKDAVRFLIGDTDPDDPLLQDEEILYLLEHTNEVEGAAAEAAYSLAARFSRQADKSVGDLSLSLSQKSAAFWQLAESLWRRSGLRALPFAGGISKSQKRATEADADRVKPAFSRSMFSNR